jgi:TatD DNase family protein
MLIDAHAHLDHYDDTQLPQVLTEIEHYRVLTLSVAMDPASYARACGVAEQSAWIIPAFGIHPWKAPDYIDELATLQPLIDESPMLGEIGLDYHWVEDPAAFPAQRTILRFFLQAAREQGKIVNLHTKGAEAEVLELLEEYAIERAIVHWYSGPLDIALKLAARGVWFTIGVEIESSPLVQALAERLPLEQLLTETDNPGGLEWLTGEIGMPRHLPRVVSTLARLRGMDDAGMREQIRQNGMRLLAGDERLKDIQARLAAVGPARG